MQTALGLSLIVRDGEKGGIEILYNISVRKVGFTKSPQGHFPEESCLSNSLGHTTSQSVNLSPPAARFFQKHIY